MKDIQNSLDERGIAEINFILQNINERTEAQQAHISIAFKYFIEKQAPVSGLTGMPDYDCVFSGNPQAGGRFDFSIPAISLCRDTIRDLVLAFRSIKSISWFDVECINFESIHNHNAYAHYTEVKRGRRRANVD